jgi:hypothetical protein
MKRPAVERQRTLAVWRRHLLRHEGAAAVCSCERQPGRFRKGQRVGGCGKAKCYLCHAEKLLKLPDRSRKRADASWREWRGQQANEE